MPPTTPDKHDDDRSRPGWLDRLRGGAPGAGRDDEQGDGPKKPMLVLGEDRPDVEDTTPEELARRAAEAEREIAEKKRAAEAEIKAARERAEQELREQQLEVDRRERDLERERRRLERKGHVGTSSTRSHGAGTGSRVGLRPPVDHGPVHRRPLHRNWLAGTLAAVGAAGIFLGGLSSGGYTDSTALHDYRTSTLTFAAWQRTALQVDDNIAAHLSGQPATTVGNGGATGTEPGAVSRAKEAADLGDRYSSYYLDEVVEGMAAATAEGTSPIRTLASWKELRSTASYAHSEYDTRRDLESLTDGTGQTLWWILLALGSLAGLIALAYLNASLVAAGLGLLAAACAAAVLLAAPDAGAIRAAAEDQKAAVERVGDLTTLVGQKVEAATGLRSGSWVEDEDYWEWSESTGIPQSPALAKLVAEQRALGVVAGAGDDQATYAATLDYVRAASPVLEEQVDAMEASRLELEASLTRERGEVTTSGLATIGGTLAALAAYFVGAVLSARRGKSGDRSPAKERS